jgi:hypothetical protein
MRPVRAAKPVFHPVSIMLRTSLWASGIGSTLFSASASAAPPETVVRITTRVKIMMKSALDFVGVALGAEGGKGEAGAGYEDGDRGRWRD